MLNANSRAHHSWFSGLGGSLGRSKDGNTDRCPSSDGGNRVVCFGSKLALGAFPKADATRDIRFGAPQAWPEPGKCDGSS